MDNNLSDQQKAFLDDALKRAGAYEELIRTKGWEYIKAYYESRVKALASGLLVSDRPIEEFDGERRELIGLRKLLGSIESDLNVLADFRKKNEPKPSE